MPLDFPTSPTNGQTYNGYVYSTSVGAWQTKPNSQSPFYTSDTPPGNPVTGDSWFNTNDGTMYIYTYDGNTYQWVEHRSQIAKSQVGMFPVVPSSVVLAAGTSSVSANGMITLTGATNVSLNGVFSSGYKNYRILFEMATASAVPGTQFRLRANGTDASGAADYAWIGPRAINWNGISINGTTGGSSWGIFDTYSGGSIQVLVMDVFRPMDTINTKYNMNSYHYSASLGTSYYAGHHKQNVAYDGFSYLNTVAFDGTMQVLGYNS